MPAWQRLKHLARTFVLHERPAWTATALWLAMVGAAIIWKGAPYDSTIRLDLSDWADIAAFVSAVVAPIAVLWVVRSFYVQKRELSEAVTAATSQAAALREQNIMLLEDRARALAPRLVMGVRSDVAKEAASSLFNKSGQDIFKEEFTFRVRNTGYGTAYEVTMLLHGVIAKNIAPWIEKSPILLEVMPTDGGAEHRVSRSLNPAHSQTVNLLITLTYRRMDRSLGQQFFLYNCVTGTVDETTEERFGELLAADGHV